MAQRWLPWVLGQMGKQRAEKARFYQSREGADASIKKDKGGPLDYRYVHMTAAWLKYMHAVIHKFYMFCICNDVTHWHRQRATEWPMTHPYCPSDSRRRPCWMRWEAQLRQRRGYLEMQVPRSMIRLSQNEAENSTIQHAFCGVCHFLHPNHFLLHSIL